MSCCSSWPPWWSRWSAGSGRRCWPRSPVALLLNFFLTPPLYTFTIAERENVITLVAMVLVAVLVALVVDRAARRAQQAAAARAEAALLASFSRTVLTGPAATAPAAGPGARGVRPDYGGRAAATRRAVADLRLLGPPDCTRPEQADVDVAVEPGIHLVGRGRALAAADRRLLDAVAGQALLALRNQQIAAEAAEAHRRADATELRTALLSAVGHDLRTPLASIKAAAGGLRDPHAAAVRRRPRRAGRHHRRVGRPAHPGGEQPARLLPGGHRGAAARAAPGRLRRDRRRSRCAGSTRASTRTGCGWRSTNGCPRCWPTPACWSGWWPTWWTTPCGTGPAPRSRCAPAATPSTSSCGWSTRAPACRPGGPSTCSPRSSASATATTTGSGSG